MFPVISRRQLSVLLGGTFFCWCKTRRVLVSVSQCVHHYQRQVLVPTIPASAFPTVLVEPFCQWPDFFVVLCTLHCALGKCFPPPCISRRRMSQDTYVNEQVMCSSVYTVAGCHGASRWASRVCNCFREGGSLQRANRWCPGGDSTGSVW